VHVIEDDGGRVEVVGDVDFGAVDEVVVLPDDLPDGIVVDEDVVIAVVAVVDDEEEEEEDEEGERSVAHGGDGDVGASVAKTGEIATTARNPTARPTSERRYIETPISARKPHAIAETSGVTIITERPGRGAPRDHVRSRSGMTERVLSQDVTWGPVLFVAFCSHSDDFVTKFGAAGGHVPGSIPGPRTCRSDPSGATDAISPTVVESGWVRIQVKRMRRPSGDGTACGSER
jgi:hypothetical protein